MDPKGIAGNVPIPQLGITLYFLFKYQLLTVLAKAYILYKLGDLFKEQLEILLHFSKMYNIHTWYLLGAIVSGL